MDVRLFLHSFFALLRFFISLLHLSVFVDVYL